MFESDPLNREDDVSALEKKADSASSAASSTKYSITERLPESTVLHSRSHNGERLAPERERGGQILRYPADMATPTTAHTTALSIIDAAGVLHVDADALLDEIRNAAAEAERPSARD